MFFLAPLASAVSAPASMFVSGALAADRVFRRRD